METNFDLEITPVGSFDTTTGPNIEGASGAHSTLKSNIFHMSDVTFGT
jgi:hypothetical protein